jgi:hypothetical protein
MVTLPRRARLLVLAAALLAVAPAGNAWADTNLRESLEELSRLADELEALFDGWPWYGHPRITEDGDIIIPRRGGRLAPPPEEEILEL